MAKQKKIMLLGGAAHIVPVIETAHKHGIFVITVDYLPDNIAHHYSDEYVNVSIIDKDAVLKAAQEHDIDGIVSFGIDPGVESAAYVQEQMHLPALGPYQSARILQNKDLFRTFLTEHGFNVPKSKGFASKKEAISDLSWYEYPMIVKPADGSGSKGVTRVDNETELIKALDVAFERSRCGNVIVEAFIEKDGCSSDCDAFSVNGELKSIYYSAQHFDDQSANIYTPAAYSWPCTFTNEQQNYLTSEIQRLLRLLNMGTTVYNIETRVGKDGKPYIMEVTPRGGGNRLSEIVHLMTGVDYIEANVLGAIGETPIVEQKPIEGYWAEVILHADKEGIFEGISISSKMRPYIVEVAPTIEIGQKIEPFTCASDANGTIVLRFDDKEIMENAIAHQSEWLTMRVKSDS